MRHVNATVIPAKRRPVLHTGAGLCPVIPAKAGIHTFGGHALCMRRFAFKQWIPAFAGMTALRVCTD